MAVLSEPGLYFFLGRSDKPKALPFQKWLAGEVLPAIRKTGRYEAQPSQPPAHLFLTPGELAEIREAAANVARYFRFHLSAGIAQAIYAPIYSAHKIERINDLPAGKVEEALALLKSMEAVAHAYYLESARKEKEVMNHLGQKRIAA